MDEQVKQPELERVIISLNSNELEVVFRGLLELPSKFSLTVIQSLQFQLQGQLKKEEVKDEGSTKEGV